MINDHDPSENDNATCVTERLHRPDRNLGFDLKIARLTPSQQPKMTDNNPGHVIKESGSDIAAGVVGGWSLYCQYKRPYRCPDQ